MKKLLLKIRLSTRRFKRKLQHPVFYLIAGLLFFLSMGFLLYKRPVVLVERSGHDTMVAKFETLVTKVDSAKLDQLKLKQQQQRLAALDTLNKKLEREIVFLKDSIKNEHENFIYFLRNNDPDIVGYFTNEYKR